MNKLDIATFNIDKNGGAFPERIENLSSVIYKNRFDILCLQEDYSSQKFSSGKLLNKELDYNYITTKTREKLRSGIQSSSNLTTLSKYPSSLLEEIFFDKDKQEERACQIIKIDFNGTSIVLANTHLCHLSSSRRFEQIKKILEKIEEYNSDIKVFCGDLNALPNNTELQLIEEKGFINRNDVPTHEDKVVLDYIFYKTNLNLSTESKVLLKGFSDHHCLLNSFEFFTKSKV